MQTRQVVALVIVVAIIALALVATLGYPTSRSLLPTTSFDITFTGPDTTVGGHFYYLISINYSGSWNLVYWVENFGTSPTNITNEYLGNLNGSGNFQTTISFYVVGYVEKTLCANATELKSQNNLALTLTIFNTTNSTTPSNPTVEVCGTMGV
jgi:hypothetical protein